MQAVANARYGRIAVTVALLAGLLVLAAGGGYSASKAVLADGAAYAVDGVGLDRLNAATGAPDAELLDMAKGPNRIRVVHRDNQVYLVDTVLANVTRLDPATLQLGAISSGPGQGQSGSVEVVTGGGTTALVDLKTGMLQRVDQESLEPIGSPVKIPGGTTGAVADGKGNLWAASASDGFIVRVDTKGRTTPIPVSPDGSSLTVTLVGDSPVVVDLGAGRITGIDPTTLRRSRSATLPSRPKDALKVSGADTPLPNLWALDVGAHGLYRVNLAKGTVDGPVVVGAGQLDWDAPVVQAGRVYVPNRTEHKLVVVDAKSLDRVGELTVPGAGPDFDVSLEGGALWANDPTDAKALVVDRRGESRQVGKGDGEGRRDPTPVPEPGEVLPEVPSGPVLPPVDLNQPPATAAPRPPASAPATPAPPAPPADSVVPDVKGLAQAAACAAIASVKLSCEAVEDKGGAIAKVSRQDPSPGRTLPAGGTVNVTIGTGVEVPAVTGSKREDACKAVKDARLTCVPQAVTMERGKTRDEVFEQDPAPRQMVDEDATVVVRYWGDPRRIDVPDVTGKTPREACDALATAGFTCKEEAGSGRPLGKVVTQLPATGGKADEGSEIVVTVAARTTMPDLVDGSVRVVCTTLARDLGLPAANCMKVAVDAEEDPKDTVKVTTPAPGAEVTLATQVTYVRRTGLVKMPRLVGLTPVEACEAVRAEGIVGTCTSAPDTAVGPEDSKGKVATQDPNADDRVGPGRPVAVTFYARQQVKVPTVGGDDINVACAKIEAVGLVCSRTPDNSGAWNRVSGQSPPGADLKPEGDTVTVNYDPYQRKPLRRFRRGLTGTETDTWALTAFGPTGDGDYYGILVGASFKEEGPICMAYSYGEDLPGRVAMVDWLTPDGPGAPVHHSANTSLTSPPGAGRPPPPGGVGWTVNHRRAAVVSDNPASGVTVYVVTMGYAHYFTSSLAEANGLRAGPNPPFLAGPFAAFYCWN